MALISVIMSVYNGGNYISESIESILEQTYTNFELIIINDGSTDNTEKVIQKYQDKRIRYYKLPSNKGVGFASNYGLKKARGKYIAKADADDIYHPTRLLKQKTFLDENKDIAIVGTFIEFFPDNEIAAASERYKTAKNYLEKYVNSISTWEDMKEKLSWYCCLVNSTIMARASIIKKYKYGYLSSAEDYQLFYKLNQKGYKITNINEILAKIRISSNSLSVTNRNFGSFIAPYEIKKREVKKFFNKDNREVYIWGCGGFGKNLYELLKNDGFVVNGFIDSDETKWGNFIGGLPILNPKDVISKNKESKVIVASDPGRFQITNYLKDLGYGNWEDFISF